MGPSPGRCMTVMFFMTVCTTVAMGAFGGFSDRVLLKDVSAITLHKGKQTTFRRTSPVPQLACVGGTAKGYYTPDVVQCINKGSDGYDVQWECKADMDNAFRFGSVEVVCEGYDYPEDPYIFKGSCGLEYTLDFTEEGYRRYKQQKSHSYSEPYSSHYSHDGSWGKKSKSVVGDLLFLGGVALVIYVIYKSCIAPNAVHASGQGSHQADRGDSPPPYSPPPYGFRQDYMPGSGSDSCYGSSSAGYQSHQNRNTQNQGGGFWTGAATGGLLGYLFGRNNGGYTHYQQPHYGWGHRPNPGYNSGWFSGWGSGGRPSHGGSSFFGGGASGGGGGSSASSGTRTASGFGGTRRR